MNLFDFINANGLDALKGKEFYIASYYPNKKNPLKNINGIIRPVKIKFNDKLDRTTGMYEKITYESDVHYLENQFTTIDRLGGTSQKPLFYNMNAQGCVHIFDNLSDCIAYFDEEMETHRQAVMDGFNLLASKHNKEMLKIKEKANKEQVELNDYHLQWDIVGTRSVVIRARSMEEALDKFTNRDETMKIDTDDEDIARGSELFVNGEMVEGFFR